MSELNDIRKWSHQVKKGNQPKKEVHMERQAKLFRVGKIFIGKPWKLWSVGL